MNDRNVKQCNEDVHYKSVFKNTSSLCIPYLSPLQMFSVEIYMCLQVCSVFHEYHIFKNMKTSTDERLCQQLAKAQSVLWSAIFLVLVVYVT